MRYLFLVIMAAVCMTFAACGGDDGGDVQTPPTGSGGGTGGGTVTEADWVDLYMNWDATMNQVKACVTGQGWMLVSEANKVQTYSSDSHPNVILNYGAPYTATLATSQAIYNNSSEDFYKWCIEKVKTAYSASTSQTGNTTIATASDINGWRVSITIIYTPETKATMIQFNALTNNTSGGDDSGGTSSGGDTTPGYESQWVTPYMNWNATEADVNTYMASQGWTLSDDGNSYYTNPNYPNAQIYYQYYNTMDRVRIMYNNPSYAFCDWVIEKIKMDYNVHMEDEMKISYAYVGEGSIDDINGEKVTVKMTYTPGDQSKATWFTVEFIAHISHTI